MAGCVEAFAPFRVEVSRRKGEKARVRETVSVANNALDALSFLYGRGEDDGISAPVGEAIRETVWRKSWSFCEGSGPGARAGGATVVGPSSGDEEKEVSLLPYKAAVKSLFDGSDFEYFVPTEMRYLRVQDIDWPTKEEVGSANTLDLLPPPLRDRYSKPLLAEGPYGASPEPAFAFRSETDPEYYAIVVMMWKLGMAEGRRHCEAVNGLFGVDKVGTTKARMIVDARPANVKLGVPEQLVLPGADLLGQLQAAEGVPIYVSKYDVRSYFNRLVMPEWLVPFCGLPKVPGHLMGMPDEEWVYPCLRVWPMGLSHSPFVSQAVHREVLRRAGCQMAQEISVENERWIGALVRFAIYIDDGCQFCTCLDTLWAFFRVACAALAEAGLSVKEQKCVSPTLELVEVLGMAACGKVGSYKPPKAKLQTLMRRTLALVEAKRDERGELESIVGAWAWYILPTRLAFSVFREVYVAVQEKVVDLSAQVCAELKCIVGLAPLLGVSWTRKVSGKVVATDACDSGFGVAYTEVKVDEVLGLWRYWRKFPCDGSAFDVTVEHLPANLEWKVFASAVRFPQNIDVLEVQAVLLGVRRSLSSRDCRGLIPILVDNTDVVGAVTKGRCAAFGMLAVVRRIAALCLGCCTQLLVVWVPSDSNPADAPSRSIQVRADGALDVPTQGALGE